VAKAKDYPLSGAAGKAEMTLDSAGWTACATMKWFGSVGLRTLLAIALFAAWAQPADSGAIEVSVRDSQGHPVADAVVTLQGKAGSPPLTARTDTAGRYRFAVLPLGTYTVRAEKSGTAASIAVQLAQNEAKKVDLSLQRAPEFFDEPQFIVAGVTDPTRAGGHGSDIVLRSTETLAKAAASLSQASATSAGQEKQLRDAVEREPGNAGLHHSLAVAAEKAGDALLAAREYQRAAELDPSESNLFDWGTELLTHRAVAPAIAVFTKGNRLFPHSVKMLLGLAVVWYALGVYDQAAQRFFEACDLDPGDPGPYLFLGKAQSPEITQADGFLERVARFARLQPENALANYYYAASLWRRWTGPEDGQTAAQVESLLQKSVRLDPHLAAAWLELGVVRFAAKDLQGAISAYQKAIAADPGLEEAHYRLALAYGRTGDAEKAQEEMDLHNRLSKQSAAEADRQRGEIQEFVIQLRSRTPAPPR